MPTGYTATLMEDGQTFEEFAMRCARGIGACISLRDEPLSTPIPDKFIPSDHCDKSYNEALGYLSELQGTKDKKEFARSVIGINIDQYRAIINRQTEENGRLSKMKTMVYDWEPPEDFACLKRFMLQQISVSMNDDHTYYYKKIEELENWHKSPMKYYNQILEEAEERVDSSRRYLAEAIERCDSSNSWIKGLKESIKEQA